MMQTINDKEIATIEAVILPLVVSDESIMVVLLLQLLAIMDMRDCLAESDVGP